MFRRGWQSRAIARLVLGTLGLAIAGVQPSRAQTLQKGASPAARGKTLLRFDYVGYRPARYETQAIVEPENERPNQGGLVTVYYTNVSDQPVSLAFWRANGKDESHWRLGGFLAWDRASDKQLAPGQTGVLELNAVSGEFAAGRPFKFSWVARDTWRSAGQLEGVLAEDPAQVSLVHVAENLAELEVHLRHVGETPLKLLAAEVLGQSAPAEVTWVGNELAGRGAAIGRLKLAQPLERGRGFIVRVELESHGERRSVFAHRRAFADRFPIGTWGAEPERYHEIRRLHVDTCIRGGRVDDEFFARDATRFGFRALVPYAISQLDEVRRLGPHPQAAGLLLADEPDWNTEPVGMLLEDRWVREWNPGLPTFLTLCRNVKFFEYASIADIPCHDHYCVSAPSSSKWPKSFGTRLEETGLYTRDLKAASEPKPIWVWSQGLFDWGGRPQQIVPTPDELAVQLWQNVGHGAKGILWFTLRRAQAEKFPDTTRAIRDAGRLLRLVRDDIARSEPWAGPVEKPAEVDLLPLVAWDRLFLVVTNRDYELLPRGYEFRPQRSVRLTVERPLWIRPMALLALSPDGVVPVPCDVGEGRLSFTLDELQATQLLVAVNDPALQATYEARLAEIVADEGRDFGAEPTAASP